MKIENKLRLFTSSVEKILGEKTGLIKERPLSLFNHDGKNESSDFTSVNEWLDSQINSYINSAKVHSAKHTVKIDDQFYEDMKTDLTSFLVHKQYKGNSIEVNGKRRDYSSTYRHRPEQQCNFLRYLAHANRNPKNSDIKALRSRFDRLTRHKSPSSPFITDHSEQENFTDSITLLLEKGVDRINKLLCNDLESRSIDLEEISKKAEFAASTRDTLENTVNENSTKNMTVKKTTKSNSEILHVSKPEPDLKQSNRKSFDDASNIIPQAVSKSNRVPVEKNVVPGGNLNNLEEQRGNPEIDLDYLKKLQVAAAESELFNQIENEQDKDLSQTQDSATQNYDGVDGFRVNKLAISLRGATSPALLFKLGAKDPLIKYNHSNLQEMLQNSYESSGTYTQRIERIKSMLLLPPTQMLIEARNFNLDNPKDFDNRYQEYLRALKTTATAAVELGLDQIFAQEYLGAELRSLQESGRNSNLVALFAETTRLHSDMVATIIDCIEMIDEDSVQQRQTKQETLNNNLRKKLQDLKKDKTRENKIKPFYNKILKSLSNLNDVVLKNIYTEFVVQGFLEQNRTLPTRFIANLAKKINVPKALVLAFISLSHTEKSGHFSVGNLETPGSNNWCGIFSITYLELLWKHPDSKKILMKLLKNNRESLTPADTNTLNEALNSMYKLRTKDIPQQICQSKDKTIRLTLQQKVKNVVDGFQQDNNRKVGYEQYATEHQEKSETAEKEYVKLQLKIIEVKTTIFEKNVKNKQFLAEQQFKNAMAIIKEISELVQQLDELKLKVQLKSLEKQQSDKFKTIEKKIDLILTH